MTFEEHLATFMNKDEIEQLKKAQEMDEIHCFMLNDSKVKNINDIFEDEKFQNHPHIKNAFIYNKDKNELGKDILFEAGAYYIQEPAAMMAVELLNIHEDEKVLDMCAAPGGKSFNILNKLNNTGLLVANDIHEIRAKILSSNIEKFGFGNTIVLNDDSKRYKKHFINYFDKIILDAPCSGSAMFRKNERAKNEWSIEKVLQCQKIQKELIEDAYEMLNDNGYLLYSTCSFSIEENEKVIEAFINNHCDIEIVPIALNKLYNDTIGITGGLRLYPYKFQGEGQVIFLLHKQIKDEKGTLRKPKLLKTTKAPKELKDFLVEKRIDLDLNNLILFKGNYCIANFDKLDLYDIKILRYGMEVGKVINNRFEPAHAFSKDEKMPEDIYIDLDDDETRLYLKGLTINKDGTSGYRIVRYKKIPLGWVKHVNNTLKNHYPKGLRLNF